MRRYGADILGDLARLSLANSEVHAPDLAREPDLACEPDLAAAPEVPFEEVAAKPHKWQARCAQLPFKAAGFFPTHHGCLMPLMLHHAAEPGGYGFLSCRACIAHPLPPQIIGVTIKEQTIKDHC